MDVGRDVLYVCMYACMYVGVGMYVRLFCLYVGIEGYVVFSKAGLGCVKAAS